MFEICQNLSFRTKVRDDVRRVHSGADQLDRYALFKLGIDPHGPVHRTHATLAN